MISEFWFFPSRTSIYYGGDGKGAKFFSFQEGSYFDSIAYLTLPC